MISRFLVWAALFAPSLTLAWPLGWTGNTPYSVESGQSYSVEVYQASGSSYYIELFRGGYWADAGYGWAAVYPTDYGAQTVNYWAEGYDDYSYEYDWIDRDIQITQPNSPPTVSWSSAPSYAAVGEWFAVGARGDDSDGNLSNVHVWKEWSPHAFGYGGDGYTGYSGDNGTVSYTEGPITFQAKAYDSSGAESGYIYHTIYIYIPNQSPSISWLVAPSTVYVNQNFTVRARGTDPDGNLSNVLVWKNDQPFAFNGGGNGYQNDSDANYTSSGNPGPVHFKAESMDGANAYSGMIYHTVQIVNRSPHVAITASPTTIQFGQSTSITSVATDPDSNLVFHGILVLNETGSNWYRAAQSDHSTGWGNHPTTPHFTGINYTSGAASGGSNTRTATHRPAYANATMTYHANTHDGHLWASSDPANWATCTGYAYVTVSKAPPSISGWTSRSWTGTGTAPAGSFNVTLSNPHSSAVATPTGAVTFSIVGSSGFGASPTGGAVNASTVFYPGIYTVRASYAGDANYLAGAWDVTFTVANRASVLSATAGGAGTANITYGGTTTVAATGTDPDANLYSAAWMRYASSTYFRPGNADMSRSGWQGYAADGAHYTSQNFSNDVATGGGPVSKSAVFRPPSIGTFNFLGKAGDGWGSASAWAYVNVAAAPLSVSANNATRAYSASNPAFTASYGGLVNGDTATVVSGVSFTTTATTTSTPGTYPITPSGGFAANYTLGYVNGTLTVVKANQPTLSLVASTSQVYGTSQTLGASGGAGTGALSYTIVGQSAVGVASLSGAVLTANTGSGWVDVRVTKATDTNYNAATSSTVRVTLAKANQGVLTLNAAASQAYSTTQTFSSSGGSGSGAVSYAIVGQSLAGVATLSGAVLTAASGTGWVDVRVTKAADTNYNAVTSSTVRVTLAKANQSTLSLNAAASQTYSTTQTLSSSGGSGGGAVSYAIVGQSTAGVATLSGAVLTAASGTGWVDVRVTKAADTNYNAATSSTVRVTLAKANQSTLMLNAAATQTYSTTQTLSSSGGSGSGAVSYVIVGQYTAGVATLSGAVLTAASGTGWVDVQVTKAADLNYNVGNSATVRVTLAKANQSTLTLIASATQIFNQEQILSSSGGSGIGGISFSIISQSSAGAASLSGAVLTANTGTGWVELQVMKAADSNYSAATASALVELQKQSISFVLYGTSFIYDGYEHGPTVYIANGSVPPDLTAEAAGVPYAVTAGVLRTTGDPNSSGGEFYVRIDATGPNYEGWAETSWVIVCCEASVTLHTLDHVYDGTPKAAGADTLNPSGLTVVFTYDHGGEVSSSEPILAGTYDVSATVLDQVWGGSAIGELIIAKATQAALTIASQTQNQVYGTTQTLSTSGGDGNGHVSYQIVDQYPQGGVLATIVGNQLTADTGTGWVKLRATKATGTDGRAGLDGNYHPIDSNEITVNLVKANQAALSLIVSATQTYDTTQTLASTGGSGSGALSYAIVGQSPAGVATLLGAVLTAASGTGWVDVQVTRAADNNHHAATSGVVRVSLAPAAQLAVTLNAASTQTYNTTQTLSGAGGSGSGAVSYEIVAESQPNAASLNGALLTANTGTGWADVRAVRAADANYSVATSNVIRVTFVKAVQPALILSAATNQIYNTSQTLGSSGGAGIGTISYEMVAQSAGEVATLAGAVLTANAGTGWVDVQATKAADENHEVAVSAPVRVLLAKADQVVLTISAAATQAYNATQTLSATGGSGGGALSYAIADESTPGAATLAGAVLTAATGTGWVDVQALKAADNNYNGAVSAAVRVTFARIGQEDLTLVAATTQIFDTTQTLASTGGSGTGAVSFAIVDESTEEVAILTAEMLTAASGTGWADVIAIKAGDTNYDAASSEAVRVTFAKALATVSLSNLNQVYDGTPKSPTVTTNPTTLTVDLTYDGFLTVPINAGTYAVGGTIDDPDYHGTGTGMLVIEKATPVITWSTPAPIAYGDSLSATQLNATASTAGVFVYSPASGAVLNVGPHTLGVTFNATDAANYNQGVTANVPLSVTKALPVGSFPDVTVLAPYSVAAGHLNASFSHAFSSSVVQPVGQIAYSRTVGESLPIGSTTVTATYPGDANYMSATVAATFRVLDPLADEDGDGIPNGIEQALGTEPLTSAEDDVHDATQLKLLVPNP